LGIEREVLGVDAEVEVREARAGEDAEPGHADRAGARLAVDRHQRDRLGFWSELGGAQAPAAALTGVVAAWHGIFQHWNVRTPRWIGWFVQRPEAHCLHHQRGVHARNYADFPLWDMLFGSYHNPEEFHGECGFDAPADRRLGAMLAWRDVNEDQFGSRSRGAQPAAFAQR
jgi:hypothetical protein